MTVFGSSIGGGSEPSLEPDEEPSLNPEKKLITRSSLFEDPTALQAQLDEIDTYVLTPNTLFKWLRVKLWPKRGD